MTDNTILTIANDAVSASVWLDRFDTENPARGTGRWQCGYRIVVDPAGDAYIIEGDDLRSGTVDRDAAYVDLPDMLRSLLSFAGSGAEYGRPGRQENADGGAFSPADCEALYMVSDELGMLALVLGGDD